MAYIVAASSEYMIENESVTASILTFQPELTALRRRAVNVAVESDWLPLPWRPTCQHNWPQSAATVTVATILHQ